jgi:hypothetical protein
MNPVSPAIQARDAAKNGVKQPESSFKTSIIVSTGRLIREVRDRWSESLGSHFGRDYFVQAISVTKFAPSCHLSFLSIHMEVDESHLEPETPSPVEDLHDSTFILNPTPDRPARLSSSLSNRQRLSLLDIDGGICFITRDRLPTISIQDAHIVQRRLSKEIVRASMCLSKFH